MSEKVEVEIEEEEYRCDICGKVLPNENSLRMHKLKSHRISPKTNKPAKSLSTPRGPGTPSVTQVTLVSQSDRFEETLRQCGLPEMLVRQIMVKAPEVDLNSVYHVFNLLNEFRVSKDKVALVINLWCTKERIALPPELMRELNIRLPPEPQYQYHYQPPYNVYGFPRVQPVQPQTTNIVDLAEALKVLKSNSENSETTQILLQRIAALERSLEAQREAELRRKEKEEFEKRLQETEKRYSELLEKVTEKFEGIIESLKPQQPSMDTYKSDEFRLIGQAVDRLATAIEQNRPVEQFKEAVKDLIKLTEPKEVPEELKREIEKTQSEVIDLMEKVDSSYVVEVKPGEG
ncbi:MAG: C2H2-type zinc finger protein [Candidatus Freyarchaeota archaeon]